MSQFDQEMETFLAPRHRKPTISDQVDAEQKQERSTEVERKIDNTLATVPGDLPPRNMYDYKKAAEGGALLTPDKNGGIDIPNQHAKRGMMQVAGYDVSSGQKYFNDFQDEDKFIFDGVQSLKNSKHNSVLGVPVEDASGLSMVAYGALKEGQEYDGFSQSVPKDWGSQKAQAWRAAQQAQFRKAYTDGELDFETLPDAPQIDIQTEYAEEDLSVNEGWLADAAVMFQHLQGEPYQGDPQGLHEWMVDTYSKINSPAWGGVLMTRAAFAPDTVKQAMYRSHTVYMGTDMSWNQFGRGLKYTMMDPTTYLTLGGGAVAGKMGMAIASRNMHRLLAASMSASAVGAIEGGAYTTLDDFYRQRVDVQAGMQEGYDPQQGAEAGAMGAAGGAVLGAAIPPAAEYGGKLIRKGWEKAGPTVMEGVVSGANQINRKFTGLDLPLMMQMADTTGPIDVDPANPLMKIYRGDDLPIETPGKTVDPQAFFSRAHMNIFGPEKKTGNWEKAYGPRVDKRVNPDDLMEKMAAWQRGDPQKGVPPVSMYELNNMGIPDYLRVKSQKGETVNRGEIEDLMYARQPRFRVGVMNFEEGAPVPENMAALPTIDPDQLGARLADTPWVMNMARNYPVTFKPAADFADDPKYADGAWAYKDPETGEERIYSAAANTADDVLGYVQSDLRRMTKNLTPVQKLQLSQQSDRNLLKGNPFEMTHAFQNMTIGAKEDQYANNYREVRMFTEYNGSDPDTVARERFGKPLDQLSDEGKNSEKKRATRTAEMYYDPARYNETNHFPLDVNRLSAARVHDTWTEDGDKVMFVNEIQSDLKNAVMRHAPDKEIDVEAREASMTRFMTAVENHDPKGAKVIKELLDKYDAGEIPFEIVENNLKRVVAGRQGGFNEVKEIEDSYKKMRAQWLKQDDPGRSGYIATDGWENAMLAQLFNMAAKEDYAAISLPRTKEQVAEIENWTRGVPQSIRAGVEKFYLEKLPRLLKEKKMMKRLGIRQIIPNQKLRSEEYEWDTKYGDTFNLYVIDKNKAEATPENPKPLYGAVAAPGGAVTFLGGEEEND